LLAGVLDFGSLPSLISNLITLMRPFSLPAATNPSLRFHEQAVIVELFGTEI
jgi:hypothetical protein